MTEVPVQSYGLHKILWYRLIGSVSTLATNFVNNNVFRIPVSIVQNGCIVIEDFVKGKLGYYKTRFGPCIYFPFIVYSNCGQNLSRALLRLLDSRPNEQILRANQRAFLRRRVVRLFVHKCKKKVDPHVDALQMIINYCTKAHPKKKIRVRALEKMLAKNRYRGHDLIKNFRAFLKMEIAKAGKKPRLICDGGFQAVLISGAICEYMKLKLAGEHTYQVGNRSIRIVFIESPDVVELTKAFDRLIHPQYDIEYLVYGDDACCSIEGQLFNVDIKQCDMSHTINLFNLFRKLLPSGHLLSPFLKMSFKQLEMPLLIPHPITGDLLGRLVPQSPVLYTGSNVTTIVNVFAGMMIGLSVAADPTVDVATRIINGAATAGYLITLEKCKDIEDLQFLKHSPLMCTDGRYHACLNFGPMFKALGSCKMDLPGSGDLEKRAYNFNSQLVSSWQHAGDTRFLRILYKKFPLLNNVKNVNSIISSVKSSNSGVVNHLSNAYTRRPLDESINRRYKVTNNHAEEFYEMLERASYEDSIRCEFSDAVMFKDYSYEFLGTRFVGA